MDLGHRDRRTGRWVQGRLEHGTVPGPRHFARGGMAPCMLRSQAQGVPPRSVLRVGFLPRGLHSQRRRPVARRTQAACQCYDGGGQYVGGWSRVSHSDRVECGPHRTQVRPRVATPCVWTCHSGRASAFRRTAYLCRHDGVQAPDRQATGGRLCAERATRGRTVNVLDRLEPRLGCHIPHRKPVVAGALPNRAHRAAQQTTSCDIHSPKAR